MAEFMVVFGITAAYIVAALASIVYFVRVGFAVHKYTYESDDHTITVIAGIGWPIGWTIYLCGPPAKWLIQHPPHTWTRGDEMAPVNGELTEDQPVWYGAQNGVPIDPATVLPPMAPKAKDML